jgi:hypothetical protein
MSLLVVSSSNTSEKGGEDPVFFSLSLDGREYHQVEGQGFRQWVYLICPEAFHSALRGTSLEHDIDFCYNHETCIITKDEEGRVRWEVKDVNYLVSTCCCDGIGIELLDLDLVFS